MLSSVISIPCLLGSLAVTGLAAPVIQSRVPNSKAAVITSNFPDPSMIEVDGKYWAFAGANGLPAGINVQAASSTDFISWQLETGYDALPVLGAWAANPGHVWSPDVKQLDDGTFVLYYAATSLEQPKMHCIGAATSTSVTGPFKPLDTPMFCPLAQGGAIDPDGFVDPVTSKRYVVYKVDGNSVGHGGMCSNSAAPIAPTPIMLQEVSTDGITLIGAPVELISNDPIDGCNVEAPSVIYHAPSTSYFLFYNSGCYATSAYTIRYAVSTTSAMGPYEKIENPFVATGDTLAKVYAPGGVDFGRGEGKAVFHGDLNMDWVETGNGARVRGMFAAEYSINGNQATVDYLF